MMADDHGNLQWQTSPEDARLIDLIVRRAMHMGKPHGINLDYLLSCMDVTSVHLNDRPIKLLQLLMSDNADFSGDFATIISAINRKTGKLSSDVKLLFQRKQ